MQAAAAGGKADLLMRLQVLLLGHLAWSDAGRGMESTAHRPNNRRTAPRHQPDLVRAPRRWHSHLVARSIGLSGAPLRLCSAEVHQENGGSQAPRCVLLSTAPYAWLSRRWLTRSGDVSCLTSPCGHVSEAHKRPRAALHNMYERRQASASRSLVLRFGRKRHEKRRPCRPGRTALLPGINLGPGARSTPLGSRTCAAQFQLVYAARHAALLGRVHQEEGGSRAAGAVARSLTARPNSPFLRRHVHPQRLA
jgi:hypothetical protein